jgi:hypothetical protein
LHGIRKHIGVLLETKWDEIFGELKVEIIVPLYHKTNILGLQAFLQDTFKLWARNGNCLEEIRENSKDNIF